MYITVQSIVVNHESVPCLLNRIELRAGAGEEIREKAEKSRGEMRGVELGCLFLNGRSCLHTGNFGDGNPVV